MRATVLLIYKKRDKIDDDDHPLFRFAAVQVLTLVFWTWVNCWWGWL